MYNLLGPRKKKKDGALQTEKKKMFLKPNYMKI